MSIRGHGGKQTLDNGVKEKIKINDNKTSVGGMKSCGGEEDLTSAKAIENLGRDKQNLKTELKQELMDFKKHFRNYIQREFNSFRTEINKKN